MPFPRLDGKRGFCEVRCRGSRSWQVGEPGFRSGWKGSGVPPPSRGGWWRLGLMAASRSRLSWESERGRSVPASTLSRALPAPPGPRLGAGLRWGAGLAWAFLRPPPVPLCVFREVVGVAQSLAKESFLVSVLTPAKPPPLPHTLREAAQSRRAGRSEEMAAPAGPGTGAPSVPVGTPGPFQLLLVWESV